MKEDKTMLSGLAVLATISVGTTQAAWFQVIRTGNEYRVSRYKTSLGEHFRRPDDWQPGITTQKQAWVSNNLKAEDGSLESSMPAIARVEIHQSWIWWENVYVLSQDSNETAVPPLEGEALPSDLVTDQGECQYATIPVFNKESVMVPRSGMAQDAGIHLNLSYADKVEEAGEKRFLVDEEPSETGNYISYYIGVIQPGEDSPVFLENVTVNLPLENTITGKDIYYEKTEDGYKQITVTYTNAKYGYDSNRYIMDIKVTTVQAIKAAVEHTFTGGLNQEVIRYLTDQVADPGVYDTSGLEKKLALVYNWGSQRLEYVPYRSGTGEEEGSWFTNFTDMVPGGIYKDCLKVENTTSNQTVRVYMRIDPRAQEQIKDEPLEKITMKVILQGSVLYEGKMIGARYGEGESLQELIPLCHLKGGTSEEIQVELQLDSSVICDPVTGARIHADQLTKTDWEFMIQTFSENGGGDGGGGGGGRGRGRGSVTTLTTIGDKAVPQAVVILDPEVPLAPPPKTGDTTPLLMLRAMTAVSFLLLSVLGILWIRMRRKENKV